MPNNEEIEAQIQAYQQYKAGHPTWYYQNIPDPSLKQKLLKPFYLTRCYFTRINDQFGYRFLLLLSSAYFILKGCLYQLLVASMLPYFLKYMQVDAIKYQIFGTVAITPWSMKALFGLISDTYPIRGYHKKWYIFYMGIFGALCFTAIGCVTLPRELAGVACFLFCLGHFEVAIVDLLVEGRYAELMVQHPETSSDLVTWVWSNNVMGMLVATWIVGPLGDKYEETRNSWYLRALFLLVAPLSAQISVLVGLDWLGEVPLLRSEWGFQVAKWNRHKKVFLLAIGMGVGAVGLAIVSLSNCYALDFLPKHIDYLPTLLYSACASLALIIGAFYVLPTGVAKALTYIFFISAIYINISGPVDIFYTATSNCVNDGPQFSQTYYITWSGTVAAIMGFLGVTLFQAVMSEWEFRPCFWVTTTLQVIAGLIDFVIVKRWNITVGIPDAILYMIGYNIIYQIVYMMNFMPIVVLISKLCPKGMESTLYALLAGYSNFGQSISRSIGIFLIKKMNVVMVDKGPCQHENLHWLVIIGHVLLPLLAIPATFLLLPKARLTAPLFDDELHKHFVESKENAFPIDTPVVHSTDILMQNQENMNRSTI